MADGKSRAEQRQAVLDRVRERIVARVDLGLVRAHDRLPSARELARELEVDRRLVLGAYANLEAEGLVQRRERSGVYLAPTATTTGAAAEQVNDWLAGVLVDGLARGIAIPDLPGRVEKAVESLRLHAVCVECNTDQLHALHTELGEDYGMMSFPLELEAALHPGAAEERLLAQAEVLITTSWHRRQLVPLARRLDVPLVAVELNPELWRELAHVLEEEAVYVVAEDERLGPKLRTLFRRAVGADLHFLVVDRDDLAAIPQNAVVYATRKARPRVEGWPGVRLVPELRVFAHDSARNLLRRLLQPSGH